MTTVDIPGGTATFRDKLTTERHRRPIKRAAFRAAGAISKLPQERPDEGGIKELLAALPLTRDEADSLLDLYDATILAFLESWTLDRPLPTCEDDLLDLDSEVYDALQDAASKLQTPDAVADTDFSPVPKEPEDHTGNSSDSEQP